MKKKLITAITAAVMIQGMGALPTFAADEISAPTYANYHLSGDANGDFLFNIADVVTLQCWLLGDGEKIKIDRLNSDMCTDGALDVYDLCLMKGKLMAKGAGEKAVPELSELADMTDKEAQEALSGMTYEEVTDKWGTPDGWSSGLFGGGWKVGDRILWITFDFEEPMQEDMFTWTTWDVCFEG